MSDSTTAARPESAAAPPRPRAHVFEALAKLLAVAAVYPPTHPRIAEIVEPVLAAVRAESTTGGRLRLDVPAARAKDAAPTPQDRLLGDLADLGVAAIEIASDASAADLAAFARFLKQSAGGRSFDASFRHAAFDAIPKSIRVEERSFAAPEFADEVTADPTAASDETTEAEEPSSIEPRLLDLVWRAVRAALPEPREASERADAPGAAAQASEHLAAATSNTVVAWLSRRCAATGTSPQEILDQAERALPGTMPGVRWKPVLDSLRRAVGQHLAPGFEKEARAEFDRKTAVPLEAAAVSASDDDLLRTIARVTDGAPPFALDAALDRAEQLTLLLSLPDLAFDRDAVTGRLAAVLGGTFGARERAVLAGWMRDVAAFDRPRETDRRLRPVVDVLRVADRRRPTDVLVEACREPVAGIAAAIWPELVYELATNDDDAAREPIARIVSRIPGARIASEPDRLRELIAKRGGMVALSALFPPRRELGAFYAALLDTPREAGFASAVTEAFAEHPPQHPAAGALAVMDAGEERTHRFLARILREDDRPTAASRALAAEVLAAALRDAPAEQRGDEWVTAAVGSLADLPCAASHAFLREVVSARRLFVLPAWPETARHLASLGLAKPLGARGGVA